MNKGLTLHNICIMKGQQPLIEVDHHIDPGAVLTVMGPSGVGKSTLLSFVTGTLAPDFSAKGAALLDGQDLSGIAPHRRQIGLLFQDHLLFPHMSVGSNVAFGLPKGGSRKERRIQVERALASVDLEGYADRDPETLSGGQKARVALVRMLLSQPRAVLLDEPFSGLNADLRTQVRDLVFKTARERGLPVLMVTHDAKDAEAAGGPVIELERLSNA